MQERDFWRRQESVSEEEQTLETKLNNLLTMKDVFSGEYIKAKERLRNASGDKTEIVEELNNIEEIYYIIVKARDELLESLTK